MKRPIAIVTAKIYQIVDDDSFGRFVFQKASHHAAIVAADGNKAIETE